MNSINQEIERKFLVRQLPANLEELPHALIEQGYLARDANGCEVRLRKKGARTILTVKRGMGRVRDEREIELTHSQFEALWPLTEGRRLTKTRYESQHGERTIEIDVYGGANSGLTVAEVEFDSETSANEFDPPHWFGEDVSGVRAYSNSYLARE